MALAMGSFGTFYGKYVRPNVSCMGDENSILNCPYDKFRACQKDSFLGYAVVSCFNGTLSTSMYIFLVFLSVPEAIWNAVNVLYLGYKQEFKVCDNTLNFIESCENTTS